MSKLSSRPKSKKQTARRRQQLAARTAQAVTIIASLMAVTYVVVRIFNWVRFF